MKHLKLFESMVGKDQKEINKILLMLVRLVIDQEESNKDNRLYHPDVVFAYEEFSAPHIYSLLLGGRENLIMSINYLFDERINRIGDIKNKSGFGIDINTMKISDTHYDTELIYYRDVYRLLKYCDDSDSLKRNLTQWEDIEKIESKKSY